MSPVDQSPTEKNPFDVPLPEQLPTPTLTPALRAVHESALSQSFLPVLLLPRFRPTQPRGSLGDLEKRLRDTAFPSSPSTETRECKDFKALVEKLGIENSTGVLWRLQEVDRAGRACLESNRRREAQQKHCTQLRNRMSDLGKEREKLLRSGAPEESIKEQSDRLLELQNLLLKRIIACCGSEGDIGRCLKPAHLVSP